MLFNTEDQVPLTGDNKKYTYGENCGTTHGDLKLNKRNEN
jgi:hypothetical protein